MGESFGKRRKIYVNHPSGESKICLIHGLSHSSYKCKVLGDFGAKYAKFEPTKDRENHPIPRNKFNRKQENNDSVNNSVDEILLNETHKVSDVREVPGFLESEYDKN